MAPPTTAAELADQDRERRVVADAVTKAIVDAYYPDRVRIANTARSRAQAAQSVITALAGALIAGFTVTAVADQGIFIKLGACLAVALWLLASVLYVVAVAVSAPAVGQDGEAADESALIRIILDRSRAEAAVVDRRQHRANTAASMALGVTAITFTAGVLAPPPSVPGTVYVNTDGVRSLQAACGSGVVTVHGRIEEASLSEQLVKVEVNAGVCDDHAGRELVLPRAAVLLIESEG